MAFNGALNKHHQHFFPLYLPVINVCCVFKEFVLCCNHNCSFPQKQFLVKPSFDSSVYSVTSSCPASTNRSICSKSGTCQSLPSRLQPFCQLNKEKRVAKCIQRQKLRTVLQRTLLTCKNMSRDNTEVPGRCMPATAQAGLCSRLFC